MDFDILVNLISPTKHRLTTNTVLKGKYIEKELVYVPKSKVLFVMTPTWHASKFSTWVIRDKIRRLGYSYLSYHVNPDVLTPDYKSSKKYILNFINEIVKDIKKYSKEYEFDEIHIAGFSLGSLYATIVANKCKEVSKVTLVTMGNSVAEVLFDSCATKDLKKVLLKNKMPLKKLNNYWKEINPENNINNLKGKDIKIIISKVDRIIKHKYSIKFINKLKEKGIHPHVIENNNQGHYGTIFKFLLHPKKYL